MVFTETNKLKYLNQIPPIHPSIDYSKVTFIKSNIFKHIILSNYHSSSFKTIFLVQCNLIFLIKKHKLSKASNSYPNKRKIFIQVHLLIKEIKLPLIFITNSLQSKLKWSVKRNLHQLKMSNLNNKFFMKVKNIISILFLW